MRMLGDRPAQRAHVAATGSRSRSRLLHVLLGPLLGGVVLLAARAAPAWADGRWLDSPAPERWNQPGMALPAPPPPELPLDPRAIARERAPQTAPDAALAGAGWRLFAPYQAGWGIQVVQAAGSYDGMGRPWHYQVFVFVDGQFAGTLSPEPMDSRTDGALDTVLLTGPGTLLAEFRRYAPDDPLCCPSGGATVQYRVERGAAGAIVVPERADASDIGGPPPAGAGPTSGAVTVVGVSRVLTIDAPARGAGVSSPFEVRGSGAVAPFESTLVYRVYDAAGRVIGQGPITVQGTMGQPFAFATQVSFPAGSSGQGWLEVLEPNAAGGPPLISLSVPITLRGAAK
jgi:hypothetical protein